MHVRPILEEALFLKGEDNLTALCRKILLLNLVSTDVLEPHVLVVLDLSDHVRNANAAK